MKDKYGNSPFVVALLKISAKIYQKTGVILIREYFRDKWFVEHAVSLYNASPKDFGFTFSVELGMWDCYYGFYRPLTKRTINGINRKIQSRR